MQATHKMASYREKEDKNPPKQKRKHAHTPKTRTSPNAIKSIIFVSIVHPNLISSLIKVVLFSVRGYL